MFARCLSLPLGTITRNVSRPIIQKPVIGVLRATPVLRMSTQAEPLGPSNSASKQTVQFDGEPYTAIREGSAHILVTKSAESDAVKNAANEEEAQRVFYNPIQQFNRDLTVLAIKAYGAEVVARKKSIMDKRVKRKRDNEPINDDRPPKVTKTTEPNGENNTKESVPAQAELPNQDVAEEPVRAAETTTNGDEIKHNDAAQGLTQDTQNLQNRPRKLSPPRFTILDALSASGLRALRYAHELPFVTSVTANDLTATAVESIKRNVQYNKLNEKIKVVQGDALAHMYTLIAEELSQSHAHNPRHQRKSNIPPSNKYDVIDLDPYGTAATFFDAAVQAVREDGGLLCVTCTDAGVWATHGYAEKSFALYGGIPVKGFHSHEAGLRLILHGIATSAARYGLAIEPLLSLSIDYYGRLFVKVKKSPASVKFLAGKTMVVYNCDQGCGAWETQLLMRNKKAPNKKATGAFYKHGLAQGPSADQHCKHCGSKMHLAGPMYAGPLHSSEFIKRILDDLPNAPTDIYGTVPRIEGMLQTALEEHLTPPLDDQPTCNEDELATVDPYPFYFHPSYLSSSLHCQCPPEDGLRGALRHLGYEVTRSHCKPGSLKTNAPWSVIWHVMREWVRQKAPVREDRVKEGSPTYRLLRMGSQDQSLSEGKEDKGDPIDKLEVVFDQKLGRDISKRGLVRYQINPKENWGPQSKATGH